MTQPDRPAMLRGGNRIHRVKVVWSTNLGGDPNRSRLGRTKDLLLFGIPI